MHVFVCLFTSAKMADFFDHEAVEGSTDESDFSGSDAEIGVKRKKGKKEKRKKKVRRVVNSDDDDEEEGKCCFTLIC